MKKHLVSCLAAAFATALLHAAPTDDVKAAAKKLAEAPNYTWTTTTENAGGGGGGFGGGKLTGTTEKNGYTVTTRETQNGSFSTVRKGEQMAMQNFQTGEWMSAEEMRAQFQGRGGGGGGGGGGGANGGGRGRGGAGGGLFGGGAAPGEDIDALLAVVQDLKVVDGALVGTLGAEEVSRRLSFGGRGGGGGQASAAKDGSATVKFWLKDGAIAKYSVQVKGTVAGRDGQERQVDRTTTTEISGVGTTKVEVPEAAKKKLGA